MRSELTEIRVPETDLDGEGPIVLFEWHVDEGDLVSSGQTILDFITSHGFHAFAADRAGQIEEILIPDGARVEVGETVGYLAPAP